MTAAADETAPSASGTGKGALARTALAALAGVAIMIAIFAPQNQKFDQLALGPETVAVFGAYQGDVIHCTTIDTAAECLKPAIARNLHPMIVWAGNSQLHGINQPKAGDETAPVLLARDLRPRGAEVLAFSQPNADLQEHELLFEYLLAQGKPDIFILPICFDDTREDGIRDEMAVGFKDPAVRRALEGAPLGVRLAQAQQNASLPGDAKKTLQEVVEARLEGFLSDHSTLWSARAQARGTIADNLYVLRNAVLGIQPTSKRRTIEPIYRRNMDSLHAILARARAENVRVLTYVTPLRNDVAPPYDAAEYARFKSEVQAMAAAEGATFTDLENLVPANDWGTKNSTSSTQGQEIDFMHFQGAGHVLLKQAIAAQLAAMLK